MARINNSKRKQYTRKHKTKNIMKSLKQQGGLLSDTNLFIRNPALVNVHNTNPQASLDLDNKFTSYGGPVASSCLHGGSQSKKQATTTFKQYLNQLNDKLDIPLSGGGYTTDPSEYIAGRPVYKGYDDCCPPAIINGTLKFGGSPNVPVCGSGAMRGGEQQHTTITKKQRNKSKRNKTQRNKSNKHKNYNTKKNTQFGGNWTRSSKSAEYANAFNGPKSVFAYPDDLSKRVFGEVQPNYSVNAI